MKPYSTGRRTSHDLPLLHKGSLEESVTRYIKKSYKAQTISYQNGQKGMDNPQNRGKRSRINWSSRSRKTVLIIISAILTFIGPTYTVYLLVNTLKIGYVVSMAAGFALFMVGLGLIGYMYKKKMIR